MSEQNSHLTRILPHVYCFEDTCNVYAVTSGNEGILIDFGSGRILSHLAELGITKILAVLHTHHHRDQCQGDQAATSLGIPIYTPAHEKRLFEEAELLWSSRQLWDMYNVRNTLFAPTRNISVAGVLEDYRYFQLGDLKFFVLPTPGHTLGSVSLLLRLDDRQIAFTGDLIHSPGKVLTLFDMQYNYGSTDGVEAATLSIHNLEEKGIDMLLPSHGTMMKDAQTALHETKLKLVGFYKFMNNGRMPPSELDFTVVRPHLLAAAYACAFFYVIVSDDGHALFVDYGSPSDPLFSPVQQHFEPGERVRFMEHSLSRLRGQYGVKTIDAVIPSHYHDDHINGIPYLQREFGVECWAFERMKEILEHPEGEQIGCVMPDPIVVARTFQDGESLRWRGFNFKIHYTPGHADYHMSMFGEIDGKSVGFTGDNLFIDLAPLRNATPSLIYRNHVHKTSHQITAARFLEFEPEIICTGHELQTNVGHSTYQRYMDNARELTHHFESLLPGEPNYGLEPSWVSIYPYQSHAKPGEHFEVELRVKNFNNFPVDLSFELRLPARWRTEEHSPDVRIEGNGEARRKISVGIPDSFSYGFKRIAIAADITLQGKHLGEITEAVVHLR